MSSKANTHNSTGLVSYKLFINGEAMPTTIPVLSIVVDKQINRIPSAKVVIIDGNPAEQDFAINKTDYFIPGNEIEIKLGYDSNDETVFKGIIIKNSIKVSSFSATLNIECRDKTTKLTTSRKSKVFTDSTDSDAFYTILENHEIEAEIEATELTHKQLVQYDCTDWDFILSRTQANGKVCICNNGELKIHTPDLSQEAITTITYGNNLLSFDAEMDARHQFASVTSRNWDIAQQSIIEKTANTEKLELSGNIDPEDLSKVNGEDPLELNFGSSSSDEEIQIWANAKAYFNQMAKVRGRISFEGIATCNPDSMINLQGCGDRFNGKVYISGIRHEMANGNWTTDAQFGINPEWFTEKHDISPQPAAGLFSAVNGLQVGIVLAFEEDTEGEYRIKVKCPLVDNENDGLWARVATFDAGPNRGGFFFPEEGDEVIIGFFNDNPNDAVILGSLYSSSKQPDIIPTQENNEKGFISKNGLKFIFDDEKKAISLKTQNGNKIHISENDASISISDANSNCITMNSDGIEIISSKDLKLSAEGDVEINGCNLELSANGEFKAEASTSSEITSAGTTALKGSIININ